MSTGMRMSFSLYISFNSLTPALLSYRYRYLILPPRLPEKFIVFPHQGVTSAVHMSAIATCVAIYRTCK